MCSDPSPEERENFAVALQKDECKTLQRALDKMLKDKSTPTIEVCSCVLVPINIVPR